MEQPSSALNQNELLAGLLLRASGYDAGVQIGTSPQLHLYAIVDASRGPMLIPATLDARASRVECLYRGKALEEFGDDTAWVAELLPTESTLDWIVEEGFGKRWAIFATSRLELAAFVSHLRKFTLIEDDEGTHHFFRFYDPQTLRQFLPAFDNQQLARFFKGVDAYYLENTLNPDELIEFRIDGDALTHNTHSLRLPMEAEEFST
ncbi:DUF4123 domain-containing protein [Phyllobacterium sp. YR531]|uniref:DUF4123 domain-containing protein n=1 Tax=Phyllobacterium sp. YR531 TaxID=1144343 RepID=UPI00026FC32F|nr:DUF4123 domain-containing protein [Phyllobacterium sp. YR531]EJN05780.1 hypothetical protein PMI41_00679 [Phyllobacterium sp. YR531]